MYVFKLLINRVRITYDGEGEVVSRYVISSSEEDIREYFESSMSNDDYLIMVTNIGKLSGHINPDSTISGDLELYKGSASENKIHEDLLNDYINSKVD